MTNFLVIETVDHSISQVRPFEDSGEALALARTMAQDLGYTDGYEPGEDRSRYDADWWASGDPGNSVCVFDLSGQCVIPQGEGA